MSPASGSISLVFPINLQGPWSTTDDFITIPLHLVLFSAVLVVLVKSIPIHALILSSHLFFLPTSSSVSCHLPYRIVFALFGSSLFANSTIFIFSAFSIKSLWMNKIVDCFQEAQADLSLLHCLICCILFVLTQFINHRNPKTKETENSCCNCPKNETECFYNMALCPKDAEGISNSVGPDQTSSFIAVSSWFPLFVRTYMSQYLKTFFGGTNTKRRYANLSRDTTKQHVDHAREHQLSLIRVFAICMELAQTLGYSLSTQQ